MQIAVSEEKKVLDACCGSRMFWFDKHDARAVFVDIRKERQEFINKHRLRFVNNNAATHQYLRMQAEAHAG